MFSSISKLLKLGMSVSSEQISKMVIAEDKMAYQFRTDQEAQIYQDSQIAKIAFLSVVHRQPVYSMLMHTRSSG